MTQNFEILPPRFVTNNRNIFDASSSILHHHNNSIIPAFQLLIAQDRISRRWTYHVRFVDVSLEIRSVRARVSIRPHEKWQLHVYAPRTHHVCIIVGWFYASDRNGQPASQPTNQLYYYAVAPCNSREPELNVRKARRHYRANKGFL